MRAEFERDNPLPFSRCLLRDKNWYFTKYVNRFKHYLFKVHLGFLYHCENFQTINKYISVLLLILSNPLKPDLQLFKV